MPSPQTGQLVSPPQGFVTQLCKLSGLLVLMQPDFTRGDASVCFTQNLSVQDLMSYITYETDKCFQATHEIKGGRRKLAQDLSLSWRNCLKFFCCFRVETTETWKRCKTEGYSLSTDAWRGVCRLSLEHMHAIKPI